MEQNQVTPSALERTIDITVSLADIEKEVDARLKRMARTVKMPGFRPGKVPMKIVAQTHGGQARGEAVGAAVEKAFGEKVRADQLRVAGYPQIQPKEGADEGTLAFTATFEVYPEVVVGDFAGQKVERPVLTVGEAEVDKTIDVLRKQRTSFSTSTVLATAVWRSTEGLSLTTRKRVMSPPNSCRRLTAHGLMMVLR